MKISSLPSANLFLTSADPQAASSHARIGQEAAAASEAGTTISAAGQLRAALDRLGSVALGLTNTDVFAPKPLRAENSQSQNQDQEREKDAQRAFVPAEPPPTFRPAAPALDTASRRTTRDAQPDILVSLHQSASDGNKLSLSLTEDRKAADRAAGAFDPDSVFAVPKEKTGRSDQSEGLLPVARDTGVKTTSLQDVAFGKAPGAKKAEPEEPVVAPLPAPLPAQSKPVAQAARELGSAVNELRAAVARTERSVETDSGTRAFRDQAVRALEVVDRQAGPLKRVGIERDDQGQLQLNEPALQAAVARAPEQVRQVLSDTRQGIDAQLAPPPRAATLPENTDNIAREAQEAPAPRRIEPARREPPTEPAALAAQASRLNQVLDSLAYTGARLQSELTRQDSESSSQSSLQNRLNTLSHTMSVQ